MFKFAVNQLSSYTIPLILIIIPLYGLIKGVNIYSAFISGAKDGISIAVRIIPYMVAMLLATGMVRTSGLFDHLSHLLSPITGAIGVPAEIIPFGIMRSLSGGGAQAMLTELYSTYGVDSLIGYTASVAMGSAETTLYCVSLYYGSIGISDGRYTLPVGLATDAVSLLAASWISSILF